MEVQPPARALGAPSSSWHSYSVEGARKTGNTPFPFPVGFDNFILVLSVHYPLLNIASRRLALNTTVPTVVDAMNVPMQTLSAIATSLQRHFT